VVIFSLEVEGAGSWAIDVRAIVKRVYRGAIFFISFSID
jgi:hypothetical protein